MNDTHQPSSGQSSRRRPLWPWVVSAAVLVLMSVGLSFWIPLQKRKPVVDYVKQHGVLDVEYNHPEWLFFIGEQTYHPWFNEVRTIWLESPSDESLEEIELFSEVAELGLDLSNVSPKSIERLSTFQNLESVQLTGNDNPIPLAWLGALPKLKEVWLFDIPCVVEDWKTIAASRTPIQHLRFFGVNERFTVEHAETLAALPNLRTLQWEGWEKSSQTDPDCWIPFARKGVLEVLILDDVIIEPGEMSSICRISSLRTLWVQSNPEFSTTEIEQLKRLKNLENLSLSDSELPEDAFEILASLTSLKELDLDGVHAFDDDVRTLSKSSSLESLRIEQSFVTDDGLMSLVKLSTLRQISVWDSRVTAEGIRKFQSARPDVVVYDEAPPRSY